MYSYSPIKSIYVKNFRNIGEAKIDFSESPIISLIGENEAGKTSIVKAFAVGALHAWAREQKDYIRDGTNGFGVAIELEDGSMITRMKTATVNKYSVKFADGNVWETTKIDAGLPVQVQEIMGLIEEPETKEFLQVRTYEDQLLFVTTSASTNYKVMYDALKVDQLTRAIKAGSKEANELKAAINENDASMRTLTDNIKSIKIFDIEPLINIRNRLNSQLSALDKLERAKVIHDRITEATRQLGAIGLIDKYGITEIDLLEVNRLESSNRLINANTTLIKLWQLNEKANAAESIELATINKVSDTLNKINNLQIKIKSAGALVKLGELEEINEYQAQQLNRGKSIKNKIDSDIRLLGILDTPECELVQQEDFNSVYKLARIKDILNRNTILNDEVAKLDSYVKQVEDYIKQLGAKVVNCTKCGESIVLDLGELSHSHN